MIKVLLVDDEQFIRQGLRQLVDWTEYGYEVAAEAENGLQAISILEEQDINLVFVDIRMPGMTGLELIAYVQEKIYKPIQFVILTGYSDFNYAQNAIRMHVRDYMLKPVQKNELVEILKRLNAEFLEKQSQRQDTYHFHMAQVVHGKFTEEDLGAVRAYVEDEDSWKYVSFELDSSQKEFAEKTREQKAEYQRELLSYLGKLLGTYEQYALPVTETEDAVYGAALLLVPQMYQEMGESEEDFLDKLQKRLSQHFSHPIQVYVGQEAASLEEISESFRSVRISRCLHGFSEEKSTSINISYEELKGRKASFEISEQDIDELLHAVRDNRRDAIETSAEKIFSQIRKSDMNMEMVNASIYHILYRLMEMVREFDNETNQQEILEYIGKESFNHIVLMGSSEEITGFFADYAGYLAQVRSQEKKTVMEQADAYVKEHYMENISLKSLGELFYVNNVYLGQLFKKNYGIAFREYLTNIRLEKAKELLVNTNMRVYTIAEEVGFGMVDYFISKFVQTYHITPNQYRMKHRSAKGEK